ncbi:MAG: hypothetical protein WBW93_12475 [Steroidobacteraceae bacterium]
MKRIFLFLATNVAVLAVLTIVAHLIGLDRWLTVRGSSLMSHPPLDERIAALRAPTLA